MFVLYVVFVFFFNAKNRRHGKNANKQQVVTFITRHFGPLTPQLKVIRIYLRIEKCSKDCNGSSKAVDRLDRSMKDDDGGDYDGNPLHRVSHAKRQGRDLVERHVRYLIIQVIKDTLSCHPPTHTIRTTHTKEVKIEKYRIRIAASIPQNNQTRGQDTRHFPDNI